MEIFTRLLDTAANDGVVCFHPMRARVSLTHLLFASDIIVFIKASKESLQDVKIELSQSLDRFNKLSGLQVSVSKSEIFSLQFHLSNRVLWLHFWVLRLGCFR